LPAGPDTACRPGAPPGQRRSSTPSTDVGRLDDAGGVRAKRHRSERHRRRTSPGCGDVGPRRARAQSSGRFSPSRQKKQAGRPASILPSRGAKRAPGGRGARQDGRACGGDFSGKGLVGRTSRSTPTTFVNESGTRSTRTLIEAGRPGARAFILVFLRMAPGHAGAGHHRAGEPSSAPLAAMAGDRASAIKLSTLFADCVDGAIGIVVDGRHRGGRGRRPQLSRKGDERAMTRRSAPWTALFGHDHGHHGWS